MWGSQWAGGGKAFDAEGMAPAREVPGCKPGLKALVAPEARGLCWQVTRYHWGNGGERVAVCASTPVCPTSQFELLFGNEFLLLF